MVEALASYSAPGKALLAGGYLVLFPEYSALSVGLSSRMHAVAYPSTNDSGELLIESPQFDSKWSYPSQSGTHKNPFMDACYSVTRDYFNTDISGKVTIWSDDGFHSQTDAKKGHFSRELGRFSYHGRPITEVPKTGLGSSAALTVVAVAAITRLATVKLGKKELSHTQIHNLSQIAHSMAQLKVGSGFDVATAVFGSIIYSRFSVDEIPTEINHKMLLAAADKKWKMKVNPCNLPKNVAIVMGDVAQGSETPGMVREVLRWKSENPEEARTLFQGLNDANMELARSLNLEKGQEDDISRAIHAVRENLRALTKSSGVPIEPERQTRLLDESTAVNGVLGGVVPGAGGDDAICLLVDTSARSIDETLADLRNIEGVSWLSLRLESEGLKLEDNEKYAL